MKTEKELEAIKAELSLIHKPLYTVVLEAGDAFDAGETRTLFFKKFDRLTLSAVQKLASNDNSQKAIEVFCKATLVGGDDLTEILNDIDMSRSLESVIGDMISVKKATLKKS